MTWTAWLLAGYVLASLAYWGYGVYSLLRVRRLPNLADLQPPEPPAWPRLSVVAPACNEADKLEPAARSLLEQDYPDLQLILVDDRSTDATGQLIDGLAREDPRVRAVHVADLPDGWLGKVHAMARGLDQATGDYVLFTDADVHFAPGALRKAVAYCLAEGLDHLAAFPTVWPAGAVVDAAVAVFVRQFVMASRLWAAGDPASRAFAGIGAFNLVRRAALDRTAGLAWIALDIADDMALGMMLKRAGARCRIVSAFGLVGLHWYRSVAEAARGAEKAYGPVSRLSLARTLGIAAVQLAMETAPVLAPLGLLRADCRPIGLAGLAVTAACVVCGLLLRSWARVHRWAALAGPLAAPLLTGLFVRGGWLGWRRGGVAWRGRLYTSKTLRAGMRVKIP